MVKFSDFYGTQGFHKLLKIKNYSVIHVPYVTQRKQKLDMNGNKREREMFV